MAFEPVDVGDVADAALADARRRHPGVDFAFGDAGELTVVGDESGLRSAIDNLLENAARHGARTVRVGIGGRLPSTTTGQASRRRTVSACSSASPAGRGGSGLGLAIVAQQAALHGGEARIEDSSLGGRGVVVTMRP